MVGIREVINNPLIIIIFRVKEQKGFITKLIFKNVITTRWLPNYPLHNNIQFVEERRTFKEMIKSLVEDALFYANYLIGLLRNINYYYLDNGARSAEDIFAFPKKKKIRGLICCICYVSVELNCSILTLFHEMTKRILP